MSDRPPLTPERLCELLGQLDTVMTEAARLRRVVTRQLDQQSRRIQQKVTTSQKRSRKRR